MFPKEAQEALKKHGYTYDASLSTPEAKVFKDAEGKPNIAFRGTKRVSDWGTNALLAMGLERYSKRFAEAKDLTRLVEQTYGAPANTFGHSLGGSLAEKSGAHGHISTYNKGVGIFDIGKTIPRNQTDVRTTDDLVSALAPTQKHRGRYFEIPTYGTGFIDAHNIQ